MNDFNIPGRAALPLSLLVTLAALLVAPDPSVAQEVRGSLLEAQSKRPILLGKMELMDTTGVVVDQATTNAAGAFILRAPEPGAYLVRASRIGYGTRTDGVIDLGEGGRITIDFFLNPLPVEIEGIKASVTREVQHKFLETQGYYRREDQGFGHFIGPEELESRPVFDATDLMRRVPFVDVQQSASSLAGEIITMRRGGNFCTPDVWLDGGRIAFTGDQVVLDEVVDVDDIAAVEVYTGIAGRPFEFTTRNSCGAIVIWTIWGALIRGG